jgi:hypothetical protein
LTVFLAFFAPRFTVFARFFCADALAELRDVRVFFALRFLTVFFLAFATTNSFYRSNKIVGGTITSAAPQRVASASSPNTEKTSGFRSRL